jgi:translation elongation factor EF-Ts
MMNVNQKIGIKLIKKKSRIFILFFLVPFFSFKKMLRNLSSTQLIQQGILLSSKKNSVVGTTPFILAASRNAAADTKKLIQLLRARTDAPILDCKKALVECGTDDVEKCVAWLKAKGLVTADKKVGRETSTGVIAVAVARDEATGLALGATTIQLCCETDFTVGNEKFLTLANDLTLEASRLMALNGGWAALASAEAFSAEVHSKFIQPLMAAVGENIQVRRVIPLQNVKGSNLIGVYAHGSSQLAPTAGSMVAVSFLNSSSGAAPSAIQQELATDIAQTCVANYFVTDVPVEQFDVLGHSGENISIGALSKKENLALCRIFQMSNAEAETPRDIVDFKL